MSKDMEALWGKLESASQPVLRPLPKLASLSSGPSNQQNPSFRPIHQANDPLKYGIPVEKYTSVLISDRPYQAHILISEFGLLAEKLKVLSEKLMVRGRQDHDKRRFALLDREEQTDFNVKLEKTVARVQDLIVIFAKLQLVTDSTDINVPKRTNISMKEWEIYAENTVLYLSLVPILNTIFADYTRLSKYGRQRTYSLQDCTHLLKKLSQLRLGVGYLTEEIAAHEESIRVSVRTM